MTNNWAITVGINKYEFLPNASLKFAVNDALAMRSFLCEQVGFKEEQVLLCGDGQEPGSRKATRAVLRDILKNQLQRAKGADNLWFFFSGHGLAGSNQEYLVTTDGNPADLEETALPLHFVTDQLRACEAKNIVLVLDMCRDEVRNLGRKGTNPVGAGLRNLVEERENQQGIITLFSCERGQSSFETVDLKQGIFTYALLEGLKQHSIVKDLERYLSHRVQELHGLSSKKRAQIPLVIPEPGWRYDELILSNYATAEDVSRIKDMAIDAESMSQQEQALQHWEKICVISEIHEERQRAISRVREISSGSQFSTPQNSSKFQQQEIEEKEKIYHFSIPQEIEFSSSLGIDYLPLYKLLRDNKWMEADKETFRVMLEIANRGLNNRTSGPFKVLNLSTLQNFPCSDLETINQLWIYYSQENYGFEVQRRIWEKFGSPNVYGVRWAEMSINLGWNITESLTDKEASLFKLPYMWARMSGKRGAPRIFASLMERFSDCMIEKDVSDP